MPLIRFKALLAPPLGGDLYDRTKGNTMAPRTSKTNPRGESAQSDDARRTSQARSLDSSFMRMHQRIYDDLVDFASTRYERAFELSRQHQLEKAEVSNQQS